MTTAQLNVANCEKLKSNFGDFEENRSLLYEIRDLSVGCRYYATNSMDDNNDAHFFISMFAVLERNASSILKLFDKLEKLPDILKEGHHEK